MPTTPRSESPSPPPPPLQLYTSYTHIKLLRYFFAFFPVSCKDPHVIYSNDWKLMWWLAFAKSFQRTEKCNREKAPLAFSQINSCVFAALRLVEQESYQRAGKLWQRHILREELGNLICIKRWSANFDSLTTHRFLLINAISMSTASFSIMQSNQMQRNFDCATAWFHWQTALLHFFIFKCLTNFLVSAESDGTTAHFPSFPSHFHLLWQTDYLQY